MKKKLILISIIAFLFTACDKDKPITTDITINFTHTVDSFDLITNSMIYTNDAGEHYDVQTLKYFISNITLHDDLGYTRLLNRLGVCNSNLEMISGFTFQY
mgnify:CR=1 FL=1